MFELSDQASRARLGIAKGFGDGVNGHRRKFRVNELFERGRGGFLRKMLCKQGTRSLRSLSRCALVLNRSSIPISSCSPRDEQKLHPKQVCSHTNHKGPIVIAAYGRILGCALPQPLGRGARVQVAAVRSWRGKLVAIKESHFDDLATPGFKSAQKHGKNTIAVYAPLVMSAMAIGQRIGPPAGSPVKLMCASAKQHGAIGTVECLGQLDCAAATENGV